MAMMTAGYRRGGKGKGVTKWRLLMIGYYVDFWVKPA